MSDITLNAVAQAYAKKRFEDLFNEFNSEENKDLTDKGKQELLEFALFSAYLSGSKFSEERNQEKTGCVNCY
jgi:hypothetical protein